MAQFTLYKNNDSASSKTCPCFVDVQNALFGDLNSRVAIPLSPHEVLNNTYARCLCPVINLGGGAFSDDASNDIRSRVNFENGGHYLAKSPLRNPCRYRHAHIRHLKGNESNE